MKKNVLGVPWFQRKDYARILEVMADAHSLPRSFNAWQVHAEKVCRDVARLGSEAFPVVIEPEQFLEWCRSRDIRPDGKARAEFATAIAEGRSVGSG